MAYYQGAFKVSKGFLEEFGPRRVVDTPITEAGFTGVDIGAAMVGLRPVIEMMTFNFAILALDQIVNNAAKIRYMSGGQLSVPIVVRGPERGPSTGRSAFSEPGVLVLPCSRFEGDHAGDAEGMRRVY